MRSEPPFPCAGLSVGADLEPQRLALPGLHCSERITAYFPDLSILIALLYIEY